MSFVSYAQNFEDVLLWRALGHIENGFYIDVGANDPEQHSVTKAFYERGWHGVNVEPLKQYQPAFLEQRPRDINLCVAAGAEEGQITLYDVPAVPGWASADPGVAHAHEQEGYELLAHTVPLKTLSGICAEHVSQDIHFLKIDVEGHEEMVLRGMDFERWRPWILVIEATMPNSRETNHETWEAMVTGKRYQFAYFDGLNRYYVAAEHRELIASLQVQPNVFDDFISVHLAHAWSAREAALAQAHASEERAKNEQTLRIEAGARAENAVARGIDAVLKLVSSEERRHLAQADRDQANQARHTAEAQLADLRVELRAADESGRAASAWGHDLSRQLEQIHTSLTWRATMPLRLFGSAIGNARSSGPLLRRVVAAAAARSKRTARAAVRAIVRWAPVRTHVLPRLLRIPAVEARLRRLSAALKEPHPYAHGGPAVEPRLGDLPPAARKALADLERARRRSTN
jgi:FkbM family methyltransferase